MLEEALHTREDMVRECKRLTAAIRKTESEKLRRDYGKRLRRLQKRLLYEDGAHG